VWPGPGVFLRLHPRFGPAGGEEEFGVHGFRYLIGNDVFQIVQPDLFYYGGMIRTMQVARMAGAAGLQITPHISGGGVPRVQDVPDERCQRHDGTGGEQGGTVRERGGRDQASDGSGLGVNIDPDYIKTHTPITG
jgi:L-alanine-DL-glutamate epimerase-like enolase superfamily enzyme